MCNEHVPRTALRGMPPLQAMGNGRTEDLSCFDCRQPIMRHVTHQVGSRVCAFHLPVDEVVEPLPRAVKGWNSCWTMAFLCCCGQLSGVRRLLSVRGGPAPHAKYPERFRLNRVRSERHPVKSHAARPVPSHQRHSLRQHIMRTGSLLGRRYLAVSHGVLPSNPSSLSMS